MNKEIWESENVSDIMIAKSRVFGRENDFNQGTRTHPGNLMEAIIAST
jgi:hypothetical protein